MKKYIYIIALFIGITSTIAQTPEIKTDLPTIIPPSPTVAALMKFEEVPVSNYTGIPDVSIPLFSSTTHSKDIGINIALKYHSGVGANDRASDVGLGWSLFAGGSISRTVRGLPDEQLVMASGSSNAGKVGLYHTSIANHINSYYFFENNVITSNGTTMTNNDVERVNEFLWESAEKGKYDTEHDLWQFNFMGNSGRFYIKKNSQTNQLEVKPLDDYRVIIINNYATVNNNNYVPIGFTIFDEKGYKYIFDIIEKTETKTATRLSWDNLVPDSESVSASKIYNSSFHLSKVYDTNNKLVVEFIYNPDNEVIKECYTNTSEIRNEDYDNICLNDRYCKFQLNTPPDGAVPAGGICNGGPTSNFKKIKPYYTFSAISTITTVKKLQKINIVDIAEIHFIFAKDRQDTNLQLINTASSLKELTIKDWNGSLIKKYKLFYKYSQVVDKRMILSKLEENSINENSKKEYEFFYESNDSYGYYIDKDYWGYFNLIPTCAIDNLIRKEPTPSFSTTDVLQKIKYPTGGCAIFNFETNRYSFIGDQMVIDFEKNQENYHLSNTANLTFNNSVLQALPISNTENRKVKFYPSIVLNEDSNQDTRTFTLLQKVNGNWVGVYGFACSYNRGGCCIDYVLEKNQEYALKRVNLDLNYSGSDSMTIEYFSKNVVQKNYLYGGGNRIKQIGYFSSDVPKEYYKNTSISSQYIPIKEKNYSYTLPNDNSKSSGSLSFDKPILKFIQTYTPCIQCGIIDNPKISFTSYTTLNNLLALKTQGSDVGYKYVSVFESGNNGKTDYIYTSPIDYPNVNNGFIAGSVIFSTENFDYKRGFLLKETIHDNQQRKLIETENIPSFVEFIEKTGVKPFYDSNACSIGGNFLNYQNYKEYYLASREVSGNASYGGTSFSCNCGLPVDYIGYQIIYEAYGWAKLTNKTTKNYFYPNGTSTPSITQTSESFTYNPLNKQIAENTVTNSNGETLKTKYFYHTGNSVYSQNRIAEIESIETYRGAELLSKSKIIYGSTWQNNVSLLPKTIVTAKSANALENRVEYKQYDEFSNPLEVQQTGGIPITYIWGYNKTQPIAKIENATYAQVQSYVANLQTLSNGTNEGSLITALNTLRTALPNAMVTTYTFRPLIGISTVTDPKGYKMTYHYDTFNRLQFVKDQDGNILSENEYHYKN